MATLYGGSLRYNTPLVFTIGFLTLFTLGGLTGVVLSNASIDIAVHDNNISTNSLLYVKFLMCQCLKKEKILDHLIPFWVGLMDGDGSIQIGHTNKINKNE